MVPFFTSAKIVGYKIDKSKYLLEFVVLFSIPNTITSQEIDLENVSASNFKVDDMSDSQVAAYWKAAQDRGYKMNDLESLAKVRGIPASEILNSVLP